MIRTSAVPIVYIISFDIKAADRNETVDILLCRMCTCISVYYIIIHNAGELDKSVEGRGGPIIAIYEACAAHTQRAKPFGKRREEKSSARRRRRRPYQFEKIFIIIATVIYNIFSFLQKTFSSSFTSTSSFFLNCGSPSAEMRLYATGTQHNKNVM